MKTYEGYEGKQFVLIDSDGNHVKVGDAVTDFRCDAGNIRAIHAPHKPDSEGHVSVERGYYYAGVFGLKFVEAEQIEYKSAGSLHKGIKKITWHADKEVK